MPHPQTSAMRRMITQQTRRIQHGSSQALPAQLLLKRRRPGLKHLLFRSSLLLCRLFERTNRTLANRTRLRARIAVLAAEFVGWVIDAAFAFPAEKRGLHVFETGFPDGGVGWVGEAAEVGGVVVEGEVLEVRVVGAEDGFGEEGLEAAFYEVFEGGLEEGVDFCVGVAE